MTVTVNGRPREVAEGGTVAGLLEALDISEPVAVEQNGQIVDRKDFAHVILREGDVVEIVRFVGGG